MAHNIPFMDDMSKHLAPLPRAFPAALPISRIGCLPRKRQFIAHSFATWNFSFVLAGRGHYRHDGVDHPVQGPCVLCQWPGAAMHYGPDEWWHEIYFIYPPDSGGLLQRMGIDPPRQPFWQLADAGALRSVLRELEILLTEADANVDRIDRCCERMLVESLLAARQARAEGLEAEVQAIRHRVEMGWREDHDFHALAREHGLSPTHFRRLWTRLVGCPPTRHLLRLRLREAARALVESRRAIGDIARGCGFADPLYFARRFRAEYGMSASAYRELYETGLSTVTATGDRTRRSRDAEGR